MPARIIVSFLVAAFALGLFLGPAVAEERTVVGTIVRVDPAGGVLVVRDAAGASSHLPRYAVRWIGVGATRKEAAS